MPRTFLAAVLAALTLAFALPALAKAEDDKPIKALFICGGCCHDYLHQREIIPRGISARANVEWTIAYDSDKGTKKLNPVYDNPDWYKGFDVIIHDECDADVKDLNVINNTILKPHKDGLPGVVLHCGMHCYRSEGWPKVVTPWFEFTGLQSTGHRAQQPIAITYVDKESPISKGLEDWTTINEELYNNIAGHVLETAHPLARGKQSYTEKNGKQNDFDDVVAWTNLYNGKTRVFATTIGHNNVTCADPRYLELVTRGLLWSVDKLDAAHMKPAKKVYMDGAEPKEEPKADAKPAGPKADANGMIPLDLARGKTATASSSQGANSPAMALDGDGETRWCAAGATFPQWWQVDLGKPRNINGCLIAWEKTNTVYHYKIEGSADGQTWRMLSDQTDSLDRNPIREHQFVACCGKPEVDANGVRFVRVTVDGSDTGAWASFFDFEVFGTEKIKATAQTTVKPAGADPAKAVGQIKAPPGFDISLYAAPPNVAYCTAVSAAPTGAVFIGIDEDGSLGKKPDKGRVIRAIDSKGNGVADQFTVFAKMDHPRGLIWDDGKLFVLHPPFLSVYYDDNNTGVSNRSEVLVTGISNEKMVASRGADHTTNGIRLGIDGWIYIATGDFGCVKATGLKDHTELQFHYGGVLRIRPDGTGLEVYSYGTRNIYDVSIDPFANVFTRDNTNDGDDWNDRLAYDVPTGYYGYPSRFMHFPGEFIDCLADFGGGAPCGSLFVDEPAIPGGLYTVEWGNSQIDHHPLIPVGANFKVAAPNFEKFMDLPRGTDLDVDAQSHLYATSWAGGGFDYSGPNVGYVVRLTPKGYTAPPFPDLRKLTEEQLLSQLMSPSHTWRLATQREILRRGDNAAFDAGLLKVIDSAQPLAVRVAAIFTLGLLQGDKANAALAAAAQKPESREFALRAMIDRKDDRAVPVKPLLDALTDANPRVRLVGAWGLGRLGDAQAASAILPLTADADFLVAHVAVKALVALNAADVCLNAVEPSTTPGITLGALSVLKEIHDEKVVKGLIERTPRLADASTRGAAWQAICRLCYREADWDGSWWGTRPDRTGPYYKNAEWAGTEAVKTALHGALTSEKPEVIRGLVVDLQKHQISFPEMTALITKLAATDPGFQDIQIEMLSTARKFDADQIATLQSLATNEKAQPSIRAKATRVLMKDPANASAMNGAVEAIAPLLQQAAPELATLRDEFLHDPQFARHIGYFAKLGESGSPAKKEVAYSVLMNLSDSRLVKPEYKKSATSAIESAWANSANAVVLLRAVARMHADAYGDKVNSFLTDKNAEVAQAASSAEEVLRHKHGAASTEALIETMKYEDVVAAVLKIKGDAAAGHDLFQRQGCIACHTVSTKEPQKGPMLGGIAGRYNRSELCESILKPSAKIAQGFETQWFKTSDGDVLDGFVSRESGDEVEVRNATGQAIVLKKTNIVKRGKRDFSIMPEGLAVKLSPRELANLVAYLESTTGK
ncbi:MAG TPA: discoidin domain-containing protein [Tepidisphaeraceae bacterium]|nr:discoidin domain-containing protein [Tepidisphaeraceae bacterium]